VEFAPSKFKLWIYSIQPLLKFRPNTGRFWMDIINILLLAVIQMAVLPTFFGQYVYVDLMTPWIVTSIILQPFLYGAGLAVIAAIILENHSTAPAGMYIAILWVICVTINLIRSNFSWRLMLPWLATYAATTIWVLGFETLVIYVTRGTNVFEPIFVLSWIARFFICMAFGMYLCRKRYSSLINETEL